MDEVWKTVKNFTDYEVSNLGRVRSWRIKGNTRKKPTAPRILKQSVCGHKQKYLACKLYNEDKKLSHRVHRLVLETFVGPMPVGMEVRHLNGNSKDNRLENLAYGTHYDNMNDMRKHGTSNHVKGENHGMAILNEMQIRSIREEHKSGLTYIELGIKYTMHPSTIRLIVLKKLWKHI